MSRYAISKLTPAGRSLLLVFVAITSASIGVPNAIGQHSPDNDLSVASVANSVSKVASRPKRAELPSGDGRRKSLVDARAFGDRKVRRSPVSPPRRSNDDRKASAEAPPRTLASDSAVNAPRVDIRAATSTHPGSAVSARVDDAEMRPLVQSFCAANAPAAVEFRIAAQTAEMKTLEERLLRENDELTRRTGEIQAWIKRRDDAVAKADDALVGIYTRMKPDVAAQQLAAMSEEIAAAILTKIPQRTAGAVFNEMAAEKAARLAARMSAATGRRTEPDT